MASAPAGYDRLSKLKAFDDTKAGVKGLVDAGVTAVPRIFHHLAPALPHQVHHDKTTTSIPVIDLAAAGVGTADLVAQVKAAAETVGFFQVLNHGVPEASMSEMLASIKSFNEEPAEAKRPYYTRDPKRRVRYQSNFDLFQSPAANWRDTLFLEMAPTGPAPDDIPPACRAIVSEYTRQVQSLGRALLELLSEALGLHGGYLEHVAGCLDGIVVASHYYPPCPEPHLTLGTTRHSDPSFLTVLLQDGVGGLQVLLGERWVDVAPVAGALVVNIGDLLQLMSNDRFKSVEHRVVATTAGPRVSVACFFRTNGPAASSRVYGPIISKEQDPPGPGYRSVAVEEFLGYYKHKGLDGRSALDHFRLPP
ncbi:1-aminocyclopropane-1-carboxylate oxidase homolog 1-like [Phragmites australis]|uniref:1-aminocyclopropane-1-carboxylate oxidase homolog 1-like n=1 Tax=Phragmites australis TaxID=29695 RepID=UPI002D7A2A02|nr:1-aminocyclopropane-1-carboxylate oxidase homolog 1-like [Phragmites australis]